MTTDEQPGTTTGIPQKRRSRAVVLAAAISLLVVAGMAAAGAMHWRSQQQRHQAMQDAVASFEPPAEWVDWTRVDQASRGYSPICVDVACPSHSERYIVAVPEGDLTDTVVTAISEMDIGPVTAPDRPCLPEARCLYVVTGDDFVLDIVTADPFDYERNTLSGIPVGFVEISVTLAAS